MFPRWPEALRVAAVGVALTVSTMSLPAQAQDSQGETTVQEMRPTNSGYAGAAEGLEIYYEVYGEGEPIVVLAGGLMPISTTAQITGPLSDTRQVIAIARDGTAHSSATTIPSTTDDDTTNDDRTDDGGDFLARLKTPSGFVVTIAGRRVYSSEG